MRSVVGLNFSGQVIKPQPHEHSDGALDSSAFFTGTAAVGEGTALVATDEELEVDARA